MTRPPRLPDVAAVWRRRVEVDLDGGPVAVIALEDLVETKKTQRDKDWPIIGALIEADMVRHRAEPTGDRIHFWLREARGADELIELARTFPDVADSVKQNRPLIGAAQDQDRSNLELELAREQIRGKQADRGYWEPLRTELEPIDAETRTLS